MLTLKQLDKTFGAGTASAHHALCGIDLTLQDGEFVTVIGSNGAGKSTLFGAVSGSFFVDRGRIVLDGEDITYLPEYKRAKRIARIFQDPMRGTAPDLTLEENVALAYARAGGHLFAPALPRKKRAFFREQLARLDMGLEDRVKTRIGLLSGGQRQAVTLLMATINTPRVLLLDEHTAALDPVVAGARAAHHAGHRGGKSHHDHDGHAQHRRGAVARHAHHHARARKDRARPVGRDARQAGCAGSACAVPRGVRRGAG